MNFQPFTQKILFGHNLIFDNLIELYNNNKLPNKILLSGEKGIGKSTLAYHLINFILSSDEDYSYDKKNYKINPDNKSFKLLMNKTNPNFYLIDVNEDRKNIDINQIRELILNLNKSSFNLKPRFVLIDNIELLNTNSVNALLKILEEPNDNINFILINNNKKILPTLKSRCLNFKVFLTKEESVEISNRIINKNINDLLNHELMNHYITPGQLLKILEFSDEYEINLKNINLKEFLLILITDRIYKKEKSINKIIFYFIELYFRNNISANNNNLFELYRYFLTKINNTKIYNLDEETLFMEFEDKVLNG